jgi:hypothetical protein
MKPVIILENNVEFWKLFLQKFPKSDVSLIIVTDDRISDKMEELQNTAKQMRPDLSITYISGKQLIKESFDILWPNGTSDLIKDFVFNYKLSCKFFYPIYFKKFEKYLMVDDDVFMVLDPSFLFESDKYLASVDSFNKFGWKDKYYKNFEIVCKKEIETYDYNIYTINTGILLYQRDLEYGNYIKGLFENEFFCNLYLKYKQKNTTYNKLFFVEQYLFNFYLKTRENFKSKFEVLKNVRIITNPTIPGKFTKVPFAIHYTSGKEKMNLCHTFKHYEIINGYLTNTKKEN